MSWWIRQRTALIAAFVAVVALIGVSLWLDVLPVAQSAPASPRVAEGTVEIGGNQLEVVDVTSGEFEAPTGSHTLSVRLDASSSDDAERCATIRLGEAHGDRVWLTADSEVDVRYGDDEKSSCRAGTASYGILVVFLLPDDADGPFWLDIDVGRRTTRFAVDG